MTAPELWTGGQHRDEPSPPTGRFAAFCARLVRVLPRRLAARVPPDLVGFAIINGFTFGVDLALLSVLHGVLGWPLALAITVAYLAAFGLSFVLNRVLNFRSHAPVGRQTLLYAGTIGINYAVFLLGVSTGLAALGVPYQVARIAAGACEGIFMYCALRWVVFAKRFERDQRQTRPQS